MPLTDPRSRGLVRRTKAGRALSSFPSDSAKRRGTSDRTRAIFAGALVPLAVGEIVVLTLLAMSALNTAWGESLGSLGSLALVLPGTLVLGCVFAFPISAALVCTLSWLTRHTRYADSLLAWTLAGPVFATPLALLLWTLDAPASVPYGLLFGFLLGALGSFAAGLTRPHVKVAVGEKGS